LALGNCKFCETAIHADQQLWKDLLDGFARTLMFTPHSAGACQHHNWRNQLWLLKNSFLQKSRK